MQDISRLKELLGDRFADMTSRDEAVSGGGGGDEATLTNSKEIYCECNTLVLRPNHARLIVPSESMLELEKSLIHLSGDRFSKDLVRGCYWLVDDMYKFEQISYTKEIRPEHLKHSTPKQEASSTSSTVAEPQQTTTSSSLPNSLRYLACAECNLCPLGWFDSKTKESYLYVW